MRVMPLALTVFLSFVSKGQILERLLKTDTSQIVQKVLADTAKYRLQIIYTEIGERKNFFATSKLRLNTSYFRRKPMEYFFPASMVKLPVTALAIERINSLSVFGISTATPFAPLSDFQCVGKTSTPPQSTYDLIKRIYVFSDNTAYNYLYELCGQSFIQQRLSELGYSNTRIVEKIARCNAEGNRTTGPIAFYNNQQLVHIEGRQIATKSGASKLNAKVGRGYLWNGKYIASPKDFSESNVLPLEDVHQMMMSLVFPKEMESNKRFQITEAQRKMILDHMATLPSQYCPDSCEKNTLKDNYVKYLMGAKDTLPSSWRVSNKVGLAHGFISDCTFMNDTQNEIQFILSAVLYVNQDGVLNDGKYEYTTIGHPFLRRLGELVYEYEKSKKSLKQY